MDIGPSLIFCCLMASIPLICDVEAKTVSVSIMKGNVNISLVEDRITIRLYKRDGDHLVLEIGKQMRLVGEPSWKRSHLTFRAVWENGAQLKIFIVSNQLIVKRFVVQWKLLYGVNDSLVECFDMSPYNWYGGGVSHRPWPIQTQPFHTTPYVPGNSTGGVVEPYFLSSAGVSYYVHRIVPLFVSIEGDTDRALCFRAEFRPPYRNTDLRPLTLQYTVSYSDPPNMTLLWLDDSAFQFGHPSTTPSFTLVRNPVWSTWTYDKTFVDQDTVLDFAEQIRSNQFPGSQIEIDSAGWEGCDGEGTFNPTTFPDPANMIGRIRKLGFEVTLRVHPFVSTECRRVYEEGEREKYFVTVDGYSVTGRTTRSKGNSSAVIDVTNEAAREWWANRLNALRDLGVAAFRFDTPDSWFLPHNAFLQTAEAKQPGQYFSAFAAFARQFGSQVQAKFGYFSQRVNGTFLSFLNKYSDWSSDSGLQSVITSALHSGIVGYPFIMVDSTADKWPDRELYIRWTQLNAFLPVMSFSIPPWNYDDQVVRIARKMVELHASMSDVIENAMLEATVSGSPIIRPLWWMNSNDDITLTIADEFLVGSTYLVAPIVSGGAIARDIYITKGTWTDMLRGGDIIGPKWLYNYAIALDEIAYFRIKY